jgi:hypothetical protein
MLTQHRSGRGATIRIRQCIRDRTNKRRIIPVHPDLYARDASLFQAPSMRRQCSLLGVRLHHPEI